MCGLFFFIRCVFSHKVWFIFLIRCGLFFPIFSSYFSTFLNMGGYELDQKRGMMGVHCGLFFSFGFVFSSR